MSFQKNSALTKIRVRLRKALANAKILAAPKAINNRGPGPVCKTRPKAKSHFGLRTPDVFNIGALHEYLARFYEFPDEQISRPKNRLNFVLQTSGQDIRWRSKHLRQCRRQIAIG